MFEINKINPHEVLIEDSHRVRAEEFVSGNIDLSVLPDESQASITGHVAKLIAAAEVTLFIAEPGAYYGYFVRGTIGGEPRAIVVVGKKEDTEVRTEIILADEEQLKDLQD